MLRRRTTQSSQGTQRVVCSAGSARSAWTFVQTVFFVVAISLPLAANLAGMDGGDEAAENRALATMDEGLTKWFEDHFGFRSVLVRWNAEILYFGLRTSPSASVARGRDGWLFYADDHAIEDYANAQPLSSEEVAIWRAEIVRARDWLQSKEIAFVFAIAPDKHVLYPEAFPSTVREVGSRPRMDQVFDAVKDLGMAIDVRPALAAAKQNDRIYHRTDTHWNDRGALVAYQAMIDAVRAQNPAVPAPWKRSDFDAVVKQTEGQDLAGMIGLKRVLREENLALVPKRPRLAKVVEPAGAIPTSAEGRLVTEIPGSTLPRALIFRDSFMTPLVPFVSEHFSRAVYLWQNELVPEQVIAEHPDVVIYEIVGRHLYDYLPSPELAGDH